MNVIETFYGAFARRDADAMAACYADDVVFTDPVFPGLRGDEARDMWRMLCARGNDLVIVTSDIVVDGDRARAHWDATYTFGATKRRVENHIDATFRLRDGRIAEHVDRFDLYAWCRMALGVPGVLFGWAPPFHDALRKTARRGLDEFREKRASLR